MAHARSQHPNAVLTPQGRRRMVALCAGAGLDDRGDRGAVPGRRQDRAQVAGPVPRRGRGRVCRTGRADRTAHRTGHPGRRRAGGRSCAAQRRWGADHIAHELGLAASTVQSILRAAGLGRLDRGDRATDSRAGRAATSATGPASWSTSTSRRSPPSPPAAAGGCTAGATPPSPAHASVGYRYIHTAIDDRTRLAYCEILDDEQAATAAAFWHRAVAWFAAHGVTVERVLTDNGACYRSRLWRARLRRAPASPTNAPGPTGPRPTARSSASTGSCSRNGPTSATGPANPTPSRATTASSTSTITTDPTAHSAGQTPIATLNRLSRDNLPAEHT